MKFWIIYNDGSHSKIYYEIVNTIVKGIEYYNYIYDLIPVSKLTECNCDIPLISNINPDYIWFWDRNWKLAYKLEKLGLKCINSPKRSLICENKFFTFKKLNDFDGLIPKTDFYKNFKLFDPNSYGKFPIILKLSYSELGKNVFTINNYSDIRKLIVNKRLKNFMLQEYINYLPNVEVKIITTQTKIISCYKREKISDQYVITPYIPSDYEIEIALRCCKIVGLTFVGIDLMYKDKFSPVICDINTQSNFYTVYEELGFNPVTKIIAEL